MGKRYSEHFNILKSKKDQQYFKKRKGLFLLNSYKVLFENCFIKYNYGCSKIV